ncbi:MAG: hypothetical protein ACQET8_13580 [Bacillota bacterium]
MWRRPIIDRKYSIVGVSGGTLDVPGEDKELSGEKHYFTGGCETFTGETSVISGERVTKIKTRTVKSTTLKDFI